MNELDLLRKLLSTKNDLQDAKLNEHYEDNEERKEVAAANRATIETQIIALEDELVQIADKKYSQKAKVALLKQLNHYIEQIEQVALNKPGARLTRSQGMIVENMLLGFIAKDLYYLISDDIFSIHIPAYLQYTRSEQDSISISELSNLLRTEIAILNSLNETNYVTLHQYFEEFKERLFERFGNIEY